MQPMPALEPWSPGDVRVLNALARYLIVHLVWIYIYSSL